MIFTVHYADSDGDLMIFCLDNPHYFLVFILPTLDKGNWL